MTSSCAKAIRRKKAAAVMCNLAAERKSAPQVHMPASLISTMRTTRHPHRLLQRWKSSKTVSRPPSRAPFLSLSDINNAHHYDPMRRINTRQVKRRVCVSV